MITLPNGDKWILGDGDSKEEEMSPQDFIRALCEGEDDEYKDLPRKYTSQFGGYWDANFDAFKEIPEALCIKSFDKPHFKVYELPWGEVLAIFTEFDDGGYEACIVPVLFTSKEAYNKIVCI